MDFMASSDDDSDYSFYSDSDSDSDQFFAGYCGQPRKKKVQNYISLPQLKLDYSENMDMEKKILLFLAAGDDEDIPFMERLMSHGVSVDCIGRDGWTALMKACLNGRPVVAQFLLNNGSNPNFQANLFNSLMACCTSGMVSEQLKLSCVELLLQFNADVNLNDRHKATPLMHAASSGYLTIMKRLLRVDGIKIHVRDFEGWNAVFHAVSNNQVAAARLLIEHGVEFRSRDNFGRTPQVLADEKNFKKLSDLLSEMEYRCLEQYGEEDEEDRETFYWKLLRELPDADGEGGFPSEARAILSSYGCENVENISFPHFLNMTEKELYLVGVKVDVLRRDILRKVIHKFHLYPWMTTSLHSITRGVPMGMEDGVSIIGSVVKHLTIIKASVRYLETRINARKRKAELSSQKDTINVLVSFYCTNRLVQERLKGIIRLQENVKTFYSDDTIYKTVKNDSKLSPALKYGMIVLGATTAGYLIFHFRLKIDGFVKEFIENKTLPSMRWF